jgi:hypothetical protein
MATTTTFTRSLMPGPADLLLLAGVIAGGYLIWSRYIKGSTSECCDHLEGIPKALCNLGGDLTGDSLGGTCNPEGGGGLYPPTGGTGPDTPGAGWLCENLRSQYCFAKAQFYGVFNRSQYDLCLAAWNECEGIP